MNGFIKESSLMLEDAELIVLYNSGHTFDQIAKQFGVTKGTVAGRIHRLRQKGYEINKRTRIKKPKVVKKKKRKVIDVILENIMANNIIHFPKREAKPSHEQWVALENTETRSCRYTKDGKLFCNCPIPEKRSQLWCDEHLKIVYKVAV